MAESESDGSPLFERVRGWFARGSGERPQEEGGEAGLDGHGAENGHGAEDSDKAGDSHTAEDGHEGDEGHEGEEAEESGEGQESWRWMLHRRSLAVIPAAAVLVGLLLWALGSGGSTNAGNADQRTPSSATGTTTPTGRPVPTAVPHSVASPPTGTIVTGNTGVGDTGAGNTGAGSTGAGNSGVGDTGVGNTGAGAVGNTGVDNTGAGPVGNTGVDNTGASTGSTGASAPAPPASATSPSFPSNFTTPTTPPPATAPPATAPPATAPPATAPPASAPPATAPPATAPPTTSPGTSVTPTSPPPSPSLLASATSGLKDGQTTGIAVTGFSPNATLRIVECDGNPQPNCDPSTARLVAAPAGSFFGLYPDAPGAPGLSREILVPSGLIDCATQACVLEVQNAADPAQAAPPVRIAFDATVPPPAAPSASVNMNSQPLTVSGSGFNPNALVAVLECASNPHSATACDPSTEMGVASSATGGISLPYAKEKQVISVSQGNVDCSQAGACVLSVTNVFRNAQGTLVPIVLGSTG